MSCLNFCFFRDEALDDPNTNYKGIDFVTDARNTCPMTVMIFYPVFTYILQALRHSKVKLTWDEDDPERNQITRRTMTKQEIEEANFKAYLASSTSGSDSEVDSPESQKYNAKGRETGKKNASRDKLRALLLGGDDGALPEGWGRGNEDESKDVDMEITFMPALTEVNDKEETTLEKYERKTKEKRKRRKDELKEKVVEKDQSRKGRIDDDFFDADSEEEQKDIVERANTDKGQKKRKDQRGSPILEVASCHESTVGELALLAVSDNPNEEPKHFNLKSVLKAERKSKDKRKRSKKKGEHDDNEIQGDFVIDVKDDRFKVLYEDHTFAIDPSNPQYVSSKFHQLRSMINS